MANSTSNVEDYLMDMLSVADELSGSRKSNITSKQCPKLTTEDDPLKSSPIIQKTKKEISPGVMQYTMKITERLPCGGASAQKHTSYVLNKNTGTLITVERTDMITNPKKNEQNSFEVPEEY